MELSISAVTNRLKYGKLWRLSNTKKGMVKVYKSLSGKNITAINEDGTIKKRVEKELLDNNTTRYKSYYDLPNDKHKLVITTIKRDDNGKICNIKIDDNTEIGHEGLIIKDDYSVTNVFVQPDKIVVQTPHPIKTVLSSVINEYFIEKNGKIKFKNLDINGVLKNLDESLKRIISTGNMWNIREQRIPKTSIFHGINLEKLIIAKH